MHRDKWTGKLKPWSEEAALESDDIFRRQVPHRWDFVNLGMELVLNDLPARVHCWIPASRIDPWFGYALWQWHHGGEKCVPSRENVV